MHPMRKRTKYWTVLETKQRTSADARRHVAAQGFPIYHPMFREASDRGVRQPRPLLPNYLFVQVDIRDAAWCALRSTRGVSRVMTISGVPALVSDEYVEHMHSCEDELGYYVIPEHEAPRFAPGQLVRGKRGLFEDQVGIYEGLGRTHRDARRIVFDILGRSAEFEVSVHDLEATSILAV